MNHALALAGAHLPTLGPDWLDPEHLINGFLDRWGTWAVFAICCVIIIETGLLFPFLPGDSLLFTVGLFVGTGAIDMPIWVAALTMGVAAFVGDQIGFGIGHYAGPRIFNRPNSRLFKQEYADQTEKFFDKYGPRAIILARFVPFVRTYVPVAAGVGRMHWGHFARYNAIGAVVWGVGVTLLGYWLGGFPVVSENIEVALILVVFVSLLPIIIETINHRVAARRAAAAVVDAVEDEVTPTQQPPTA
ncbi:VTT domain-containing protein [Demequina oxidasica]|uniref:VTT domain-containing protein n=1 Tax=Demequina oxidasica TaxID=676199 RepID=UPI0009FCA261|nr:VTT domain-containing protein [Demequina oxidasica]